MPAAEKPDIEYRQKQEVKPKSIWKEMSYTEIALIVLAVGYLFYLNNSTALVLNLNSGNETRIINGIQNPPNTVLYRENDYVPKSNVSNTQAFFGAVIILALVTALLSKIINIPKRATIQEAIEDTAKQIIKIRNIEGASISPTKNGLKIISDIEEIEMFCEFLTRYKSDNDGRWAFRYTIKVVITNKEDNVQEYYKAFYHPWSRFWDGLLATSKGLSDEDRCPKCGSEYDERIVSSKDLLAFRAARHFAGEKGERR